MKVKVPLFKTSCLMSLARLAVIVTCGVLLFGCSATIESQYADGSKSKIVVPYSYQWNEQTKTLQSDERIVKATSDALIEIAKQSPEIIAEISKNAMEAQKQNKQ